MRARLLAFVFLGLAAFAFAGASAGASGNAPLSPNQAEAPEGFDRARPGVARGKISSFDYASEDGARHRAMIHTPPDFSPTRKYPVLYLLHGASGDEQTWIRDIHADAILDNLYAERRLVPMLVVMPSMLSVSEREQAGARREARTRAGGAFGEVLLRDLIPFVESRHPALSGREHRAIAGLSMGAGVALGTGLVNPDKFAWIGSFSGAGLRRFANDLPAGLDSPARRPRLLWLSVGDQDTMMAGSVAAADAFLAERKLPHIFRINSGGHEPRVWRNDLYHFAPLLFRP